jgi:hypothetical protein
MQLHRQSAVRFFLQYSGNSEVQPGTGGAACIVGETAAFVNENK